MKSSVKKYVLWGCGLLALVAILLPTGLFLLSRIRPELFENGHDHLHCMPQIGLALKQYAVDHGEKFPFHPNGYGDALLMLASNYLDVANGNLYTGHGYDGKVFAEAYRKHTHIPEEKCGRVYVQGLTESADSNIALLFDKLPSAHVREIYFVGGHQQWIPNAEWKDFTTKQIELLVSNGIPRETAVSYYQETLDGK